MKINYEDYRKTLAKLKENYREQYRTQGYRKAMKARASYTVFREAHPEHMARLTREWKGYLKLEGFVNTRSDLEERIKELEEAIE